MTITTKFNYNDEVWYMNDDKPVKDQIQQFAITCKYAGGSASGWGNSTFPIIISYSFTQDSKYVTKTEAECFPTKEDLLKSL